jgi:hypothetical protein
MKSLLLIAAIAALGATLYLADRPGLPAREAATPGVAEPGRAVAAQSEVVRLAEASLALRRQGEPQIVAYAPYAGPQPQQLFGRK